MVDYDGHSVYQVYLEKDEKTIKIKDLRIFEDGSINPKTSLSIYNTVIYLINPSLSF